MKVAWLSDSLPISPRYKRVIFCSFPWTQRREIYADVKTVCSTYVRTPMDDPFLEYLWLNSCRSAAVPRQGIHHFYNGQLYSIRTVDRKHFWQAGSVSNNSRQCNCWLRASDSHDPDLPSRKQQLPIQWNNRTTSRKRAGTKWPGSV